jgi:hypothetical protein
MQAYKIDPKAKTLTPVEYTGDFKQIAELIGEGTKYFTTVNLGGGDALFVDDEGLLTIPEEGRAFFTMKGYSNPNLRAHPKCRGQQPLIGSAIVLGSDSEGSPTQPQPLTIERLKNALRWHDEPFTQADVEKMGPLMQFTAM